VKYGVTHFPLCFSVYIVGVGCVVGRGVRLEYYTNCPTLARQCCKPCPHKVIIEPDCTADYCIYGAYTPGLLYNGMWSSLYSKYANIFKLSSRAGVTLICVP